MRILITCLILSFTLFSSCGDEDTIVPVIGKVVDKVNKDPIVDARVLYNASEEFSTDINGEFSTQFNLKNLLADSISFFISKDMYHSRNFSSIVGNTQKDIFIIELEKK